MRRLLSASLLCVAMSLRAQAPVAPKEASLRDIGRKTVVAVASSDSAYISSIIDPQGIYVGYDRVRHTAQSFRDDLARHTGLYCELFQKGCKTGHNPDYTLGHALSLNPRKEDLKYKIHGNNGDLDYWELVGGDLIAIFSYRFAGGRWLLYDIHYV